MYSDWAIISVIEISINMGSKPIFRMRRNLTFKDRDFSHKKKDDRSHPFFN
jgi:hypothetical protein